MHVSNLSGGDRCVSLIVHSPVRISNAYSPGPMKSAVHFVNWMVARTKCAYCLQLNIEKRVVGNLECAPCTSKLTECSLTFLFRVVFEKDLQCNTLDLAV